MKRFAHCRLGTLAVAAIVLGMAGQAAACTGIRLQAKDGSYIYARTMEFALTIGSSVIIVPRHATFQGTTSDDKAGLAWNAKYGVVGLNGMGELLVIDGVNEKGLASGIFLMPGYAKYQAVSKADKSKTLAPWEVVTWILTNFATVDEVRAALPGIKVGNVFFEGLGQVPPLHYVVHDAAGNSLVIEYLDGQLTLANDPIGVITNSPDFGWHIKNLDNYVNLTADNAQTQSIDGMKISAFGQGSGLHGIPGDFTPASRFVRAFILSRTTVAGDEGPDAVQRAFHILDSFDIPYGSVRGAPDDETTFELTRWTSASDMTNLQFYLHTHDNRRVRRVDLKKVDFNCREVFVIPLKMEEDYEDLTPHSGT